MSGFCAWCGKFGPTPFAILIPSGHWRDCCAPCQRRGYIGPERFCRDGERDARCKAGEP